MLKRVVRALGRLILKGVAVLALIVCLVSAAGGVWKLTHTAPPLRGQLIELGGHRLRLVCEGPRSPAPLVLFEAGIYGFAADFGELQRRLTAVGVRSCAYDRAGLGFSDPDPGVRDGVTVVRDLEVLLREAGETGPLVLAAHSMGGIHARLFAGRNLDRVKGLVLLDSMSPALSGEPAARRIVRSFLKVAELGDLAAGAGLLKVIIPFYGDHIGLTGPAHEEKRWYFGDAAHYHAARHEISYALAAIDQAAAAPKVDPSVPVAVVTAGPPRRSLTPGWSEARIADAKRSRSGTIEAVPAASHASLLGHDGASVVTAAILRVVREATPPASAGR